MFAIVYVCLCSDFLFIVYCVVQTMVVCFLERENCVLFSLPLKETSSRRLIAAKQ